MDYINRITELLVEGSLGYKRVLRRGKPLKKNDYSDKDGHRQHSMSVSYKGAYRSAEKKKPGTGKYVTSTPSLRSSSPNIGAALSVKGIVNAKRFKK